MTVNIYFVQEVVHAVVLLTYEPLWDYDGNQTFILGRKSMIFLYITSVFYS